MSSSGRLWRITPEVSLPPLPCRPAAATMRASSRRRAAKGKGGGPMADEKRPAWVTRREMYPILALLYLPVAFAILGGVRADQSVLRQAGFRILFRVAVGFSVSFGEPGRRGGGRERV